MRREVHVAALYGSWLSALSVRFGAYCVREVTTSFRATTLVDSSSSSGGCPCAGIFASTQAFEHMHVHVHVLPRCTHVLRTSTHAGCSDHPSLPAALSGLRSLRFSDLTENVTEGHMWKVTEGRPLYKELA